MSESATGTIGRGPAAGRASRRTRRRAGPIATGARALVLGVLVLSVVGCGRQERLRRRAENIIRLPLGEETLVVEVVGDDSTRQLGLMHRDSLAENHGMLFIFPVRRRLSFWMKNTHVPLSIAFISEEGEILQIEDMKPEDETSTRSMHRVRHALEVPQGWFDRHGVGVGDRIESFAERLQAFRVS